MAGSDRFEDQTMGRSSEFGSLFPYLQYADHVGSCRRYRKFKQNNRRVGDKS